MSLILLMPKQALRAQLICQNELRKLVYNRSKTLESRSSKNCSSQYCPDQNYNLAIHSTVIMVMRYLLTVFLRYYTSRRCYWAFFGKKGLQVGKGGAGSMEKLHYTILSQVISCMVAYSPYFMKYYF